MGFLLTPMVDLGDRQSLTAPPSYAPPQARPRDRERDPLPRFGVEPMSAVRFAQSNITVNSGSNLQACQLAHFLPIQ
jgi:hypothetical protein